MRYVTLLGALVLVAAACGGDEGATTTATSAEAVSSTTTAATATTLAATTTLQMATTTTAPATTTAAVSEDAWTVDGTVFEVGDCFAAPDGSPTGGMGSQAGEVSGAIRVSAPAAHPTDAVPCDGPHAGEVIGTGSSCPVGMIGDEIDPTHFSAGIDVDALLELVADYAGVPVADVAGWLGSEGLVLRFDREADEAMEITDTMCYLGGANGDLTGSYRAGG